MLSNNDRRLIRTLCETLKSKTPLDLQMIQTLLEKENSRIFLATFIEGRDLNQPEKKVYRKHVDQLNPSDLKELFSRAEGFKRESLRIRIEGGIIRNFTCVQLRDGPIINPWFEERILDTNACDK